MLEYAGRKLVMASFETRRVVRLDLQIGESLGIAALIWAIRRPERAVCPRLLVGLSRPGRHFRRMYPMRRIDGPPLTRC